MRHMVYMHCLISSSQRLHAMPWLSSIYRRSSKKTSYSSRLAHYTSHLESPLTVPEVCLLALSRSSLTTLWGREPAHFQRTFPELLKISPQGEVGFRLRSSVPDSEVPSAHRTGRDSLLRPWAAGQGSKCRSCLHRFSRLIFRPITSLCLSFTSVT